MSRFVAFCCALLVAMAVRAELPDPVMQALREAEIPDDAVGVFVQRVDRDAPLVAHRADQALNPASAMKLVTTYAALELLGPAFTWQTDFHAGGEVRGDTLHGDLILKGRGDPAMTLESFWGLVRALRQKGVRHVRGDLLLDRTYFSAQDHDPAAFDGEPYRAYNAGPDALLVNFKSTRFRFRGDPSGDKVVIEADPALPQLTVVNRLALARTPCADWKDRLGYRVAQDGAMATVTFGGSYAMDCGEKSLELSLHNGDTYVFELFRQFWREQGGSFSGAAKAGVVPGDVVLLARADSPPLADVVRLINKYSNNVMARQLLLTLGAEVSGVPGSVENGGQAIRDWLAGKRRDFPELVVDNGAGLSREARISARNLGGLLLDAYASPVMPELMSSLPLAAVDGTLAQRMKDGGVAGRAHLKTGSLNGVRSMAGYLLDAEGRRWVVVFMVNHPRASASRPAQEALLEWIHGRR